MIMCMMMYIMSTYMMLFAALSNAVSLHNAYSFAIYSCKFYLFSCFVLVYRHIACLFHILFCITYSALYLLVFLILCSCRLLVKGLYALW